MVVLPTKKIDPLLFVLIDSYVLDKIIKIIEVLLDE